MGTGQSTQAPAHANPERMFFTSYQVLVVTRHHHPAGFAQQALQDKFAMDSLSG
ncbi:MAG: hypothetical protein OXE74_08540 [Cyanobacteria bacterium MAG CAR2_bin_4]|nr:hypothetical protein [Cyanobacteria bacterium MAG CAR2_bin_4]